MNSKNFFRALKTMLKTSYRKHNNRTYPRPVWGFTNGGRYVPVDIKTENVSSSTKINPAIRSYLQHSNPKLLKLQSRYSELNLFDESMWQGHSTVIELLNFRGVLSYLDQLESSLRLRPMIYMYTTAFIESMDTEHLLYRLKEDSMFGAITYLFGEDLLVSRDLLDSILEIYFIKRVLGLDFNNSCVGLDIGAGYGRFAHRFTAAFPKSHIYCTDAVAVSTFLCDFYIQFREFADQAQSVPLYELDSLSDRTFDFACNIHSWSECTLNAIRFWLDRLVDLRVPYLFVVPHEPLFLSLEKDGSRVSFLPEITSHGYRMIHSENKFGTLNLALNWGISNATYAIFKLK